MNLYETESTSPDVLIAGVEQDLISIPIVLAQGANVSVRGQLLGKVTKGAATGAVTKGTGVASGTGNGTLGSISLGKNAKIGVYVLTCTGTATNGGTFSVMDPDGERLKDATVTVPYVSEHIKFTIADGDADFAAGDQFTITVAAGSGKYGKCDKDNVDGTQFPAAILATNEDATSADVTTAAYIQGEFNERAITFATGETADTHRATLQALGIILRPSVKA